MREQPQVASVARRRVEQSAKALGLGLGGIYLLVFFALCLWLVITSLSAHQIQNRARAISIAGKPVSIWVIRSAADLLGQQEVEIGNIRASLATLNSDLSVQQKLLEERQSLLRVAETSLTNNLASAEVLLDRFADAPRIVFRVGTTPTDKAKALIKAMGHIDDDQARALIKRLSVDMESFHKDSDAFGEQIQRVTKIKGDLVIKTDELKEASATANKKVEDYIYKVYGDDVGEEQKVLVQNIAGEVNGLRGLVFSSFYGLVTLQPEILTLIVVVVMGALGGLIHLTQSYLTGTDDQTTAYFVFRPILGMVTALAIYILAKAGVLVVAEARTSASQSAALSPFFISFLAIISGLLSENAIANIRKAGENFLRPVDPTGVRRWAIRVKDAMKEAGNKKTADLLPFLDHPKGEIEDWIEGRKDVPENAQHVISAWLGKPARELFTDIKPA